MPHAAPSREAPTASTELNAGAVLRLGEYAHERALNNSEARIVLHRTLEKRKEENNAPVEETDMTAKFKEYLELFSAFKEMAEAQQIDGIVGSYGKNLEGFERSQLGTLVPTCAEEAKALIPSLERKVEEGVISEEELEGICRELQRVKRQAQI